MRRFLLFCSVLLFWFEIVERYKIAIRAWLAWSLDVELKNDAHNICCNIPDCMNFVKIRLASL